MAQGSREETAINDRERGVRGARADRTAGRGRRPEGLLPARAAVPSGQKPGRPGKC